jgi:ELWxxDGT repeat protein
MSQTVVLFNATGTDDEPELWVTNGTAAGTSEVAEESIGLDPQYITNFNGVALFEGADQNPDPEALPGLWETNGTAAGTSEIGGIASSEIANANFNGLQPSYFQVYHGEALFQGAAGLAGDVVLGLWVTNGTAGGTSEIGGNKNSEIHNAYSGGLLQDPPDFTPFNGKVLFRGWDSLGEVGLWITDGTAAGTKQLAPIAGAAFGPAAPPIGYDIQPQFMAVLGNKLLFDGADQEDTEGSLWVTNGTAAGTSEVGGEGNKGIKDTPFTDPAGDLPDGLQPYDLTTFRSEVLFAGQDDTLFHGDTYNHTYALWKSNGSAAGTVEIGGFGNSEITEANTAANGGIFNFEGVADPDFTVFGSEMLFVGDDLDGHYGLWVTNGTAGGTTEIGGLAGAGLSSVLNFTGEPESSPDFTVYGSEVLFDGLDSQNHATLWETNGTASGTQEISTADIAPTDFTLFTSGAQLAVTDILQNPGSGADLKDGATVSITLVMTEDATVAGTPKLVLNDHGVASYVSGSGTPDLTFKYTVAAGQNIADLEVISASLIGATIKDADGFNADLSTVSGTVLGIEIDTTPPTVTSVTATPTSGGTVGIGHTVKIDLDLSEAVIVSGTPSLRLSDGGTAIYNASASHPTSGLLEFDYAVTSGQSSFDLSIVSASLTSGASIRDSAGNAANLTIGATKENLRLVVDGIPPKVTSAIAIESPPGTDVTSGGSVTITLKMSEAVTVSGTPFLTLSDGATANYSSSPTSNTLTFVYDVGSESTTDLKIGTITGAIVDSAGNTLSPTLSADLKLEANVHLHAYDERRGHLEFGIGLEPGGSTR